MLHLISEALDFACSPSPIVSTMRSREVLEIIADNLTKVGWSWGCVSAVLLDGRTICVADAHRGDGKRSLCTPMKS